MLLAKPIIDKNSKLWAYIQLMRLDKPVGTELLLWPTLWAVWIAGGGSPEFKIVLVFTLGALLMRSAGCAINDYADRHFDKHVARTKDRPLTSGRLSEKEALTAFMLLVCASALLLFFLPLSVLFWSLGAVTIASLYPFMKRFTYLPQFVLGAAFSWSIPMAFVAQGMLPNAACWLLFAANLCWTVAYDTQYAMTDRADDLKVGIKSTAILFAHHELKMIGLLQALTLMLLGALFYLVRLYPFAYAILGVCALLFFYQYQVDKDRAPSHAFKAFKHNVWVGRAIFIGIVLSYWLKGMLQ